MQIAKLSACCLRSAPQIANKYIFFAISLRIIIIIIILSVAHYCRDKLSNALYQIMKLQSHDFASFLLYYIYIIQIVLKSTFAKHIKQVNRFINVHFVQYYNTDLRNGEDDEGEKDMTIYIYSLVTAYHEYIYFLESGHSLRNVAILTTTTKL